MHRGVYIYIYIYIHAVAKVLGLYVIRGDNIAVVGEVDEDAKRG